MTQVRNINTTDIAAAVRHVTGQQDQPLTTDYADFTDYFLVINL